MTTAKLSCYQAHVSDENIYAALVSCPKGHDKYCENIYHYSREYSNPYPTWIKPGIGGLQRIE